MYIIFLVSAKPKDATKLYNGMADMCTEAGTEAQPVTKEQQLQKVSPAQPTPQPPTPWVGVSYSSVLKSKLVSWLLAKFHVVYVLVLKIYRGSLNLNHSP